MPTTQKLLTAAAGSAGGGALYVEDVFSTYLYEGNASGQGATAQSITNNIDLSGEGGLTWIKNRDSGGSDAWSHYLFDTERGATKYIRSNLQNVEGASNNSLSAFNSDGFTLGETGGTNNNGDSYASWTFRKAPKFFDVVTYTGDGTNSKTISHNLGSVPAMMFVKHTNGVTYWLVYDGSQGYTKYALLNSGQNFQAGPGYWVQAPTSTSFTVGDLYNDSGTNGSGGTYVVYLFASDAGGFGDDEDENIIKCGTYTGTGGAGTPPVVNLGFEPQWLLVKNATSTNTDWLLMDTMRGFGADDSDIGPPTLSPNTNGAEFDWGQYNYDLWTVNATGFTVGPTDLFNVNNTSGATYIYMAIRRPMKTPEAGTEVFSVTELSSPYGKTITTGWPVDMTIHAEVSSAGNRQVIDRLRGTRSSGPSNYLSTNLTAAEVAEASYGYGYDNNTGYLNNLWGGTDGIFYDFKRAPSFMDVVAYSGVGGGQTVNHGLGVAPEMIWIKNRDVDEPWAVGHIGLNNGVNPWEYWLMLNDVDGEQALTSTFNDTPPTATQFTVGNDRKVDYAGQDYIAYLFGTVAGVSKVGSYTGTGAALNVDCGFTAGARFILIKRTNSTNGAWYTYDSARGISAGNDPYLLLNSTAAEVTNTDYVDPLNAGFTVTSSAPAALNASGGTYIFLAIA